MFSELKGEEPPQNPSDVLRRLSDGEIDVETASRLISGD
jgi:hypothetical protein